MKDKSRILSVCSLLLHLLTVISFLVVLLGLIDYRVSNLIFDYFLCVSFTFDSVTNYRFGKPIESPPKNKWVKLFEIVVIIVITFMLIVKLFSLLS